MNVCMFSGYLVTPVEYKFFYNKNTKQNMNISFAKTRMCIDGIKHECIDVICLDKLADELYQKYELAQSIDLCGELRTPDKLERRLYHIEKNEKYYVYIHYLH